MYMPAWDTYAFLQALFLGAIAWTITLWVTPLSEFSNWDIFFCLGVPLYVYVKNAKSAEEKAEVVTGQSTEQKNAVTMAPEQDTLELLVMVKGSVPVLADSAAIVIISFATTCAPSRQSFRSLQSTFKAFRDEDVGFLAVSREDPDTIKAFLDEMRTLGTTVTFAVASDRNDVLTPLKKSLSISRTPHVFVVSRSGSVSWHGHPNALEGMLSALVG